MAYRSAVLRAKLRHLFSTVPLDPNGVQSVSVVTDTDRDGNQVVKVEETRGPVYLEEKMAAVLADVIAQAVTEFLNEES